MNLNEENDPTCVIKMLDDFRSGSDSKRRGLVPGNWPKLSFRSSQIGVQNSLTRPTKLNFDETCAQSELHPLKKLKIGYDSIDSTSSETSKTNESLILASPWETRRMKSELAEARAQYSSLETRFNQMNVLRRETELLFEQEKKALQQTMERDKNSVRELETRLKTVRKREAEAREELVQCRNALKQEILSLQDKCQDLQLQNMELKDKLTEIESIQVHSNGTSERKLATVESEAAILKSELLASRQLVEKLNLDLHDLRSEMKEWENDKSKLVTASQKVKELEFEKQSNNEAMNLVQAQQNKLLRVSELEREIVTLRDENKNLRQATNNTLYLEGLVDDMRVKLKSLEERERECINLRVELGLAQSRLEEWNNLSSIVIGQTTATSSPVGLRRQIESLQQKEVQLLADKSELELSLKVLKEKCDETSKVAEAAQTQVNNLKLTIDQHATTLRRLRKQNALITWERNDLRNLVDSCQKEVSMISGFNTDSQQSLKIEALEKLVEGYKKRTEMLEADPGLGIIDTQGSSSPQNSEKFENLISEKNILLKEKEILTKEIEELKIQMEYRALKGDFDQRTTKVLHFKMNPSSEAMGKHADELTKCQEEIIKLRARIKLLESGETHNLTLAVNEKVSENNSKELEGLKKKITSTEIQNQRLKEAFTKKSLEFREAVYTLFGYKVDCLHGKIYRISNMYAETAEEHLLFKMTEDGMELLESPFSATLSELIDMHLHHNGSIPVFLAAITMSLFQAQTSSRLDID